MFQQQSQQVVLTSRSNRHPSPEKSVKKKGKRVSQSSVKSLDQDSSNSSESNSPGMFSTVSNKSTGWNKHTLGSRIIVQARPY